MVFVLADLTVVFTGCGDDSDDPGSDSDTDTDSDTDSDTDADTDSDSDTDTDADSDSDSDSDTDTDTDSCGNVGLPCEEDPTICGDDMTCEPAETPFCTFTRLICGGFANAKCEDPEAPICMYLDAADYGVCVADWEEICICDSVPENFIPGTCE